MRKHRAPGTEARRASTPGWLDARSTGYLAWAWNAGFACAAGPGLITDYSGAPTSYGPGYRSHLRSLPERSGLAPAR